MKFILLTIIGVMVWAIEARSDDARPAEEKPASEKKAEAKAEADSEAKAKQAAQTLEALGKVFEIFGGAIGGPAFELDVPVAEAVVAGEVILDAAVAAPGEAAAGDPFEQQFVQQFRPLAKTELNFVRAVCQPNADQSKKLKIASDAALKSAVKRFAEIQKKMQQGIRAGDEPQWPDPRKLMSDVLLKSVQETMSEEAAKRYEVELGKRSAARKRAALLNLVAKIDKNLVLTADQRGKLSEALEENWKDSWCQQLETFMYGDAYFPAVPDAHVLPVLTEKQKTIWTAIPKEHHMIWGWAGFGFVQAVDIAEDAVVVEPGGEVKVEAKAAEEKSDEPKKDEKP